MVFSVGITGTNSPVLEGETMEVAATVENTGSDPGSQTIRLTIGGTVRDSQDVRLENGQSTSLTLTWSTGDGDAEEYAAAVSSADETDAVVVDVEGEPELPVTITGTSSPVTEGERLYVDARVTNATGGTLAQTIIAGLSDPTTASSPEDIEVDSLRLALDSGEAADVTLTVDAAAYEAGRAASYERTVWVGSTKGSDLATVRVNAPPTPTVAIASTTSPVTEGEALEVTADVGNSGHDSGTFLVALTGYTDARSGNRRLGNDCDPNRDPLRLVSTSRPVDATGVTLAGGDSTTMTFEWPTGAGDAGDRVVSVDAVAVDPPFEPTDRPTFLTGDPQCEVPVGIAGTAREGLWDRASERVSITPGVLRTDRFTVEIDGTEVTGWREVQLPSSSTEEGQYTDGRDPQFDPSLWGRTEYDDLTMIRGAKEAEMTLRDWRQDVIEGRREAGKRTVLISVEDDSGATTAQWEFTGAWPKHYEPPDLDASAVGGDSAFGQEELTIAYDRYKRTK